MVYGVGVVCILYAVWVGAVCSCKSVIVVLRSVKWEIFSC